MKFVLHNTNILLSTFFYKLVDLVFLPLGEVRLFKPMSAVTEGSVFIP